MTAHAAGDSQRFFEPPSPLDENRRLRRALRDVVALSTLPAIWSGRHTDQIARSLGDVLLNALSLEVVYVRPAASTSGSADVLCGRERDVRDLDRMKVALSGVIDAAGGDSPKSIADPRGTPIYLAIVRFGVGSGKGAVIAGSSRADFPTEHERLLLGVGVNQMATAVQRREIEGEVHRSEQELSEFFENATVGLHWVGPDGKIVRVNRAELEMLGYTCEEYVGRHIAEFHADAHVICDILARLNAGEKLADYPARVRCRDGSIKDVLIDSSVLWREGRFVHTRCFTRDVTGRRQAELALADTRARLDAALEAGAIATWTWDIPNNLLFADSKLAQLFSLPASDPGGDPLESYVRSIHPDDVSRVRAALEHSVQTGELYDEDYRVVQPDGSVRWVTARGRAERDSAGRPVRMPGVLVDITERKLLEEALRDADRRKDEFLATLAHELRNPLAPIRTSLELLKMPRIDSSTLQRTRAMMERQVQQLVRLVDDLLDVSRVMRGKIELRKEKVEIAGVIARAVETVQPLIDVQGHRLQLSIPNESTLVEADPVRLAQVLANLLTNAAKYSEAKGEIWVVVRRQHDDDQVEVTVRDNGIGISPSMLPRIFELFMQVDPSSTKAQGGLGIGLTLAKNLVDMHGGTLEARSAGLGKGCDLIVRLPLVSGHNAAPSERLGEEPPTVAGAGHRLLIVDDNADAAESLADLLHLLGHDVRVAHDGGSALALAEIHLPRAIFLDLGMPGMDGFEVARRLRRVQGLEHTVLAALTGWGQREDRQRTTEAGFDHHFVKPIEPATLDELLNSL